VFARPVLPDPPPPVDDIIRLVALDVTVILLPATIELNVGIIDPATVS